MRPTIECFENRVPQSKVAGQITPEACYTNTGKYAFGRKLQAKPVVNVNLAAAHGGQLKLVLVSEHCTRKRQ